MGRSNRHRRAPSATADEFERALYGESREDRKTFNPCDDRKTLQLCRQAERILCLALAGECGDDVLRELMVEAVEPMGGAAQLLVRVSAPAGIHTLAVMEKLDERSGRLRSIVAQSISRKRAPNLTFIVVARDGGVR